MSERKCWCLLPKAWRRTWRKGAVLACKCGFLWRVVVHWERTRPVYSWKRLDGEK